MTRWPLGPLFAAAAAASGRPVHPTGLAQSCYHCPHCFGTKDLAAATWVTPRTVARWATDGLVDRSADGAAVALGLHPALIWPGWTEEGLP